MKTFLIILICVIMCSPTLWVLFVIAKSKLRERKYKNMKHDGSKHNI